MVKSGVSFRVPFPRACVLIACAAVLGCGARQQKKELDWEELSTKDRSARLFEALDIQARIIRLGSAVMHFIDVRPDSSPVSHKRPAILFVHGFAGSLGDFAPTILSLSKRHRVLAFDLPGFGNSFRTDHEYSIEAYGRTLLDFVSASGAKKVHLVCHSMGGQVCLAVALEKASYVASLTLIDNAGTYDPAGFVKGVSKSAGGINVGKVVTRRGRSLAELGMGDQSHTRRFLSRNPSVLTAFSSFETNFRGEVRSLEAPTLIIWGQRDRVFNVRNALFLKENIRDSRLHIIEDAAHAPQLSHPEKVSGWIERFILENDAEKTDADS